MATLTQEQFDKVMQKNCIEPLRKFRDENPHLFQPFQLIIEKNDGTKIDLCDIRYPLDVLMAQTD